MLHTIAIHGYLSQNERPTKELLLVNEICLDWVSKEASDLQSAGRAIVDNLLALGAELQVRKPATMFGTDIVPCKGRAVQYL